MPANVKIIDPMKHFQGHLKAIDDSDERFFDGDAMRLAFDYHSNHSDSFEQSVHRLYFTLLLRCMERMNERQFLSRIDINSERLLFNVELRSIAHGLLIGPGMAYEPEWVGTFFVNILIGFHHR